MTTLREAAQAVLDQWEGWEPMPGECEELALAFDRLAEALATPEPVGKDAALLDKLENGCQNEVVVAGLSAASRIRALLSERDAALARVRELEGVLRSCTEEIAPCVLDNGGRRYCVTHGQWLPCTAKSAVLDAASALSPTAPKDEQK